MLVTMCLDRKLRDRSFAKSGEKLVRHGKSAKNVSLSAWH
jgi:hypothetical protein